jgi:hypothetical protein
MGARPAMPDRALACRAPKIPKPGLPGFSPAGFDPIAHIIYNVPLAGRSSASRFRPCYAPSAALFTGLGAGEWPPLGSGDAPIPTTAFSFLSC